VADLDGCVVAIAGAGGGLGPVVAQRLADGGATLALTDVRQESLDSVMEGLGLPEDRVDARVVDLLDSDSANGWATALEERFGRVDCVLHLVGGWKGGEPIETTSLDDYEWLHNLLVRTVQRTSRAFHGALTRSGRGRFVLISSAQAQEPEQGNASYAATKAAAESWTLALADSFAQSGSGATANVVVVNAIVTPKMREENPDKAYRTMTPAEHIAEACAFLCSEAGSRMNGKRLPLYP
jgi:NAD(P)-dependent dehydrogenase (short-subunit alcohol dehydrogenase family)